MKDKILVQDILGLAGITLDGPNGFDIQVKNSDFYKRVLTQGSIGLGESFEDGWWSVEDLAIFFAKINRVDLSEYKKYGFWNTLQFMLFNMQNETLAKLNAKKHYDDIDREVYNSFLGERITPYSCAYWRDVNSSLELAQQQKLDLIALKCYLQKGQHILDIGCGDGDFLANAVKNYGVTGVGIAHSEAQLAVARKRYGHLPGIEFRAQDFRKIPSTEKYDNIISVGMFEHVGKKNHREFFEVCRHHLGDYEDNFLLLHTIFTHSKDTRVDPWINKYIFPNAEIPNLAQIYKGSKGLFVTEDQHTSDGLDYARTLRAWRNNFNLNFHKLTSRNKHPRLKRRINYYLACSEGSFLARVNDLAQIVFTKKGSLSGYKPVRALKEEVFTRRILI